MTQKLVPTRTWAALDGQAPMATAPPLWGAKGLRPFIHKCSKNSQRFPYKGAEYSPHTPVPHKSMSSKSAQSSQRHSHNPLKHFSHPSTQHSHKRFTSYHPPRLSIDSLIRVCALSQSPNTPIPPHCVGVGGSEKGGCKGDIGRTRHIPTFYYNNIEHHN